MAAIVSSGGTTAGASPIAASGSGAPSASSPPGSSGSITDIFTQLIAAMASANASAQQATPQDLTGVEVGTEAFDLISDDRDTDADDIDDDEAGALAVAALLPGLAAPAPTLPAAAGGTAQTGAIDALSARRAEVDVTQVAVEELTGESSDGTDDGALDTTPAPVANNTAQNTNPQIAVHTMLAAHAASGTDPVPDTTINAPVGSQNWKDQLGTQLTWMAINGRDAASLRMSPENLGPVEVRIAVREGDVSVYFGASNPETRSALEQSLPRLRELFAAQGMVLTDAGVSRDAPRNHFKPQSPSPGMRGNSDATADVSVKSVTLTRAGLIDTYV